MSKLISKISISIWKCDLTLQTKIDYIYFERHPVLKSTASWTGSLPTQRLITNCSEKPSLKSSPTLSLNKASWLLWRRDKDVTNLLNANAQGQDNATPPPREWNAPSSNKERDSHAGTRSKQRYERWDGPRGRQRSPGRHWEKTWDQSMPHESHWERSWNQPSSFGNSRGKNSWESNGNSKGKRQTHPEATSPRIDERIRKDSKLTELKAI